jgi:hypothetical protein
MNKYKLLSIVLLCFSLMVLANGRAFAERDCTRQVSSSDGIKDIDIDCSSSHTVTTDNFWNQFLTGALIQRLEDSVRLNMENMQDKMSAIFSSEDNAKQAAADMKEKEQEAISDQQIKQEQEQAQMENLKEQQAIQKDRQSSMQGGWGVK